MTLADQIEKQIRAENKTRFGKLNLPPEFIAPNYGGRSIVNLSASIAQIFGADLPTAPLDAAIARKFSRGVERIVLVIVDALGWARFNASLDANAENGFNALLNQNAELVPLTSVFPSTTTAALTALWTGYTPAEHGSLGFTLFLRDYATRANMISFTPTATAELASEELLAAGLDPEKFLSVPSLPQTLARVGIPVYHHIEQPYVESALSRVQVRGAQETRGFVSSSDMWTVLRDSVEAHRQERALFTAYWSALDGIAHYYGPSSRTHDAEINNFAYSFQREFLARLSPAARDGTLFLLTADHGQLDTPIQRTIYVRDHPDLQSHLLFDYAGEPRAAYLYCVNGEADAARAYIEQELGDKFFVLDSRAALAAGLFGAGKFAPETRYRIGDLIVLPRANWILWEHADAPTMLGRHGGLAEEEMLVPLLATRLDG